MEKFSVLLRILDTLRAEAPESYKTYHPSQDEKEKLQQARSLAYIHLLLKVKFGVTEFLDRHALITEGAGDGGLDAYYIDKEKKKIYLIQSKYRDNPENFLSKSMDAQDLIKMEVEKIIKGKTDDSRGVAFNDKILRFQAELQSIRDIVKYDYIVFFLGNIYKLTDDQIRKLIDNNNYDIFDGDKTYEKLIFPLTTGTFYDPDEILITLNLDEKESARLKQRIETEFGAYHITIVFIPIAEIGRVLSKYKNAILKYNPRNYLSMKHNTVNESIKNSVIENNGNSFAVLNNGITMLASEVKFSDTTGSSNIGQLYLEKPQILNGGQTAYTLSILYEEYKSKDNNPLTGKEVMVKIITRIYDDANVDKDPDKESQFIQKISNATNRQNEVEEADRRSNHAIQIDLQQKLFNDFGYFYERKSGEFYDGLQSKIIDSKFIVNRLDFIKAYIAYRGQPALARRSSEKILFKEENFINALSDISKSSEMFMAYYIFSKMDELEKTFRGKSDSIQQFGHALIYGKWAVLCSIGLFNSKIEYKDGKDLKSAAEKMLNERLSTWSKFDEFVKVKRNGSKYFNTKTSNFELYYKISLLDEDIREFFIQ